MERHLWSKDKHVFLARMSMHVNIELQIFACHARRTCNLLCHAFNVPHCWVQSVVRFIELAIQIVARHRCPIIACNHAIRVQHRHNFEHYSFPQLNSLVAHASDGFEEALHHPARGGLTRVDSSTYHSVLLLFVERQADSGVGVLKLLKFDEVIGRVGVDTRSDCYQRNPQPR